LLAIVLTVLLINPIQHTLRGACTVIVSLA